MKKSLLGLLLAVALVAPAFAANMWVGGTLGLGDNKAYYGSDQDSRTTKSFSIAPEFGYNLNEKWDLGLSVGFGYSDYENNKAFNANAVSRRYAVAPFVRYNVMSIGNFSLLAKGYINYTYGETQYHYSVSNYISRNYGIGVVPVLSYKINDAWSVSATIDFLTLGYTHSENQNASGNVDKTDNFSLRANNGGIASVGFSYHF